MIQHHHECSMAGPNGAYCTCPIGWPKGGEVKEPHELIDPIGYDAIDKELNEIIDPFPEYHMNALRRRLGKYRQPVVKPGYLPLSTPWPLIGRPQLQFRPDCLLLWGYDDETMISDISIGHEIQGAVNTGYIPASFFGTARTYEKMIEEFQANGISPPSWIKFSTCRPSEQIIIQGYGKLTAAVMLGKMLVG